MTITTGKTSSPAPGERRIVKSTPVAAASMSLLNPSKPGKTAPSQADIGAKAYEIWLSQGKEAGHDQEHWLEAEQQLRQQ